MSKKKNIVLWGHMASGKTSLGLSLSKKMGLGFVDTDIWIEKKAKKSIPKIFSERGEESFRKLEAQVIQSLVGCRNQVIAVGGGALENEQNSEILSKLGWTVWINTPIRMLAKRLARSPLQIEKRPLVASRLPSDLQHGSQIDALVDILTEDFERRKKKYAQADIEVDGGLNTIDTLSALLSKGW